MPIRKTIRGLLVTLIAVAGLAAVNTAPASASASGFTMFSSGTVPTPWGDYPIPSGELDHGVTGDGLYVESQSAGFSAVPSLCNWTLTYELRDVNHNVVDSQKIDLGSRCDSNLYVPGVTWNKDTVPGFACAVLRVGESEIATQCHQVAG
ncbi:MAG: hypothetical protein JHC95_00500 [Solirubrobacteraceae bacterium]|nr:hypothetical protein [Solirubrobacteraceae bacterium]